MTKKDWKEIDRGKNRVAYKNTNTKEIITGTWLPKLYYGDLRSKNGIVIFEKEFKNKKQVLDYIKKLRRKY